MKFGAVALVLVVLAVPAASGASAPRLLSGGSNGDLVVSSLDGSGRVSLTAGAGLAADPSWSPDGTRVAYATNRDTGGGNGPNEIYVANADGTGITRLTFDGTAKRTPVWSPDATQLAYAGTDGAIWVLPARSGTPRRLATTPDAAVLTAWSPSGTQILAHGTTGVGDLFLISVADGAVRDLGLLTAAAFSPRGDRIAFQNTQGHLSVMDADATNARELTTMSSTSPTWIDDHMVAFTGNHFFVDKPTSKFGPPVRTNLYVVNVDEGAPPHRVTGATDEFGDARAVVDPQASPDARELLFRWPVVGGRWRANVDGTCPQRVPLDPPGGGDAVLWQPGSAPGRTDCVELWVAPSADVFPPAVALGKPATVHVEIENHGDDPATHVTVVLVPAAGSALGPCTGCDVGTLAPGATATATYTLSSRKAGFATAVATATSAETSPAPELATAVQTVQVLPCTIAGTAGADRLFGTAHPDKICGLPGADYLSAGAGNDTILGGSGSDTIFAGPGQDTVDGGDGRDTIFTRDGAPDTIDCGVQYDVAVVDRFDRTTHCERVLRR